MKNIRQAVSAVLFVAGVAIVGPASAVQIVDVFSPPSGSPAAVSVTSPFPFTHDLTKDGYILDPNGITAAQLVVILVDDNGNEDYRISFGTPQQTYDYTANLNVNEASFSFAVASQSLADLSSSGKLDVTITALSCTGSGCSSNAFQFVRSTLTVESIPGGPTGSSTLTGQSITGGATLTTAFSQNVPEPGTAALIGLAIGGLAVSRRRRQ